MGKITYIKKSRNEYLCLKCGNIIPVGSPYYKGVLFRRRPIIRCTKCGLKSYEVTTSEYVMTIGRLVEDWETDYGISDGTIDGIIDALQEMLDTCQENLDNIPEQLQEGDAGQLLQERIDELESAIDELGYANWNDILVKGYDNLDLEEQEKIDAEQEKRKGADYEDWFYGFCEGGSEVSDNWNEQVNEELSSFINDALGNLSY